jgi:hypothetical protein
MLFLLCVEYVLSFFIYIVYALKHIFKTLTLYFWTMVKGEKCKYLVLQMFVLWNFGSTLVEQRVVCIFFFIPWPAFSYENWAWNNFLKWKNKVKMHSMNWMPPPWQQQCWTTYNYVQLRNCMLCFPSFHIMELWHLFDELEFAWFFNYFVSFYMGRVSLLLIIV